MSGKDRKYADKINLLRVLNLTADEYERRVKELAKRLKI